VEREGYKNILNLPDCLNMPDKIIKIFKAFISTVYRTFRPVFKVLIRSTGRIPAGAGRKLPGNRYEKVWLTI
jgi:hypothetical protein